MAVNYFRVSYILLTVPAGLFLYLARRVIAFLMKLASVTVLKLSYKFEDIPIPSICYKPTFVVLYMTEYCFDT